MRFLVTGVSGSLGRMVAEHLLGDPETEAVIGLDARPCRPPVPGLRFVRVDLRQNEWIPLLDGVDVALHLAGADWPSRRSRRDIAAITVAGSKQFWQAVQAAGVRKVITAHSAAVYGPQASGPIPETAPLHGYEAGAYARAWAQVSDYLEATESGACTLTRLRTAWLCGPRHLALVRYVASSPVLACGYEGRALQAVHEDDLLAALDWAIRHDLPGVYNVGADDSIPFRELAALVGDRRACRPLAWLTIRAWWNWRWRQKRTPPAWVQALYRLHPLDTQKLKAAGWIPRYTTRETLAAALAALQGGT
jgi:UDP-glucose 4-epimerase